MSKPNGWVWFFLIVVVLILLVYFLNQTGVISTKRIKSDLNDKVDRFIDNVRNVPGDSELVDSPVENVWCKVQDIKVSGSLDDYVYHKVLGWDLLNRCCVYEAGGFSCQLNGTSNVRYCVAGQIPTVVTYVMRDGLFEDPLDYEFLLLDLDKEFQEGKCEVLI